ncbi:MAG: hypothetical protein V4772_04140 [Pseudomonadota bacterium]
MLNDENDSQDEPKEQRSIQSIKIGQRRLLALAHRLEPMSLKDLAIPDCRCRQAAGGRDFSAAGLSPASIIFSRP